MTTPRQPTFEVGERCYIRGMHRNYKPVIVKIEYGRVLVRTPEIPGSECEFKSHDLEKLSTTPKRGSQLK